MESYFVSKVQSGQFVFMWRLYLDIYSIFGTFMVFRNESEKLKNYILRGGGEFSWPQKWFSSYDADKMSLSYQQKLFKNIWKKKKGGVFQKIFISIFSKFEEKKKQNFLSNQFLLIDDRHLINIIRTEPCWRPGEFCSLKM